MSNLNERRILDHILANSNTSSNMGCAINKKCQRYLDASKPLNILLMICSIFIMVIGYELLATYFFDRLYSENSSVLRSYWSLYYLPWSIIGISISTIFISMVFMLASSTRSKLFLSVYAVIMIFLALANFGCLFSTLEAEKRIKLGLSKIENVSFEAMKAYNENEKYRSNWDDMQGHLFCCGATSYEDFYNATKGMSSFPESCHLQYDNNNHCYSKVNI